MYRLAPPGSRIAGGMLEANSEFPGQTIEYRAKGGQWLRFSAPVRVSGPVELRTRGYYLGSNVSYNLKKLVEMGFLDHQRSRVDRRSVRIRLTDTGREVRDIVEALYQKHVRTVEQVGGINADEFTTLNKSLHRLERFWTDQILYRL